MSKSKKYFYDGDVIWNSDAEVDAGTLLEEILADEELGSLDELIVGCWGESYDNGIQPLIDGIVAHADKFRNIKRLFIGDMDYEECEVSWIEQGDYSALWAALPELRSLTVKGSTGLSFGSIRHEQLEELEVICGGLPSSVIRQIAEAKLPRLKKLNLYLGVENYGFDGSVEDIRALLNADFIKQLEYLGLGDSEIQDEVVEAFLALNELYRIKTLDFSNGTLTDKGGQLLLDHAELLKGLDTLDLTYHYLSSDMMERLGALGIHVLMDEQMKDEEYGGEVFRFPMLTE